MSSPVNFETAPCVCSPDSKSVPEFITAIEHLRQRMSATEWRGFVKGDAELRKWRYFLSADPYTRWALMKPRGYAGDAALMDFAYGHPSVADLVVDAGSVGGDIYRVTYDAAQSQSARDRINLVARRISELTGSIDQLAIISFACGHAREVEALDSKVRQKIASFIGVDLDQESLEIASHSTSGIQFTAKHANVLTGNFDVIPRANFVYSLGLFDYLPRRAAERVLQKMWNLVLPGGVLMFANLATDAGNLAYCEAVMDWWMIPRSEGEMRGLGLGVIGEVESCVVTRKGCFYYTELSKRH